MMSKFVLNKGLDNEFIITIKQTGTTLPMVIEGADTFTAYLKDLETSTVVATVTPTVEDGPNGKIKITFYQATVDGLEVERGERCDNYYAKPMYKLVIDCSTVNNGNFVAKIDKVYVD